MVKIFPRDPIFYISDRRLYADVVRALFSHRRKTVRNNAKDEAVMEALKHEGIDLGLRAEQITPEVYLRLARRLTGASSP